MNRNTTVQDTDDRLVTVLGYCCWDDEIFIGYKTDLTKPNTMPSEPKTLDYLATYRVRLCCYTEFTQKLGNKRSQNIE